MSIPVNKSIKQVTYEGTVIPLVNQATPIEMSTIADMQSALTNSNVGKLFKYTGTTGMYVNGCLYQVVDNSGVLDFKPYYNEFALPNITDVSINGTILTCKIEANLNANDYKNYANIVKIYFDGVEKGEVNC